MYWYAVALSAIDILLNPSSGRIAKDEWVYALVVVFIVNFVKMYKYNCTKDAPIIGGGLVRILSGLRRSAVIAHY